jgi:hypothetical protein
VTQLPVGGAAFVPQGGLLYVPNPTNQANQNQNQDQDQNQNRQ